jgi:hypothetical protein
MNPGSVGFQQLRYWGKATMRKVHAAAIGLVVLSTSMSAGAFVECPRPVAYIWAGSDANQIFITYSDGYAPAGMQLAFVGNDQSVVNRTLSMLLAGHLASKTIVFRYSEGFDGSTASCTPTAWQKLIGVWIN